MSDCAFQDRSTIKREYQGFFKEWSIRKREAEHEKSKKTQGEARHLTTNNLRMIPRHIHTSLAHCRTTDSFQKRYYFDT